MTLAYAVDWLEQMLWTALLVGAPAVIVLAIVGTLVSIGQAATQVNDAAVGFAPKAVAIVVVLVVWGEWMLLRLQDFASVAMSAIAGIGPGA